MSYQRSATVLSIVLVSAWWAGVAWLSRDVRPWAIHWTTPAFAVGLLATYAALWTIAITWAFNRRIMVFRAVALTLILPIAVLILEAAALFRILDYRVIWQILFDGRSDPTRMFVDDAELYYRRPANLAWAGRPRSDMAKEWNLPIRAPGRQTFTTDSRGFRNPRELSQADVVLIGDSYVEGHYVSDQDTAAAVLERLIGRPVANLGTAGYGALQELVVLERYALPLRPRLVAWFFFEGNDLYDDDGYETMMTEEGRREHERRRERRRAKAAARSALWHEFRRASFTVNFLELLRVWMHPVFPKTVETFGWFRDKDGHDHRMYFYDYAELTITDYELGRFEKAKAAFRRGAELCHEHGVRLVVFYVPMKFRVYGDLCRFPPHSPCLDWRPWKLTDLFMDFCKEARMDCRDPTPLMREEAAGGRVLYAPDDSHWNAKGHELVARQVREVWKEMELR